jgi:hypothetical protein
MESSHFWTVPVGTVFIWQNCLYKKISEARAIAHLSPKPLRIQPDTEITPVTIQDFELIQKAPEEPTL